MKKKLFKGTALMLSATILGGSLANTTSVSAAEINPPTYSLEEKAEMDKAFKVLSVIESIPDSVLAEGSDSVNQWMAENNYDGLFQVMDAVENDEAVAYGVAGCVSAVGIAVLSNVFSITKLTKIKSALQALGGAKTFVNKLIPAYNAARASGQSKKAAATSAVKKAASAAGPEAKQALLEFFALGSIYSACFE